MTVTVERHAPNATDGRPLIATFSGAEGKIQAHLDRDTGALWFFCKGPRGGERVRGVIAPAKAAALRAWMGDGEQGRFSTGGGFSLAIKSGEDGWLVDMTQTPKGYYSMVFDADALTRLRGLLAGWTAKVRP